MELGTRLGPRRLRDGERHGYLPDYGGDDDVQLWMRNNEFVMVPRGGNIR